jgi:putative Mn2+ efflux pump MntP
MRHQSRLVVLKLLLFVLPLGLDTFAVSAALGLRGLPAKRRLRVSLLMSSFEMAMPVVGLLLGRGLGQAVGSLADYLAVAVLALVAAWMLFFEGEEGEEEKLERLASGSGLAMIALGLSISLDELAMGFTIGLLHLFHLARHQLDRGAGVSGRSARHADRRATRRNDSRDSRATGCIRPARSRRPTPQREAGRMTD